MVARGYNSFNGYTNSLIVNDFNTNFSTVMKQRIKAPKIARIAMYDDSQSMILGKLNSYSEGEEIDLLNIINGIRSVVVRDMKQKGIKT